MELNMPNELKNCPINEVYEKFKHLDILLSDASWCSNTDDPSPAWDTCHELWMAIKNYNTRQPERRVEVENHCKDCCCAKSWEALGITKYTGKSIVEYILELKEKAWKYDELCK